MSFLHRVPEWLKLKLRLYDDQHIKPFKQVVEEEYPPAPCGNSYEHYFQIEINDFPCPYCLARENARKQRQRDEQLAQVIADKILERLKAECHDDSEQHF